MWHPRWRPIVCIYIFPVFCFCFSFSIHSFSSIIGGRTVATKRDIANLYRVMYNKACDTWTSRKCGSVFACASWMISHSLKPLYVQRACNSMQTMAVGQRTTPTPPHLPQNHKWMGPLFLHRCRTAFLIMNGHYIYIKSTCDRTVRSGPVNMHTKYK